MNPNSSNNIYERNHQPNNNDQQQNQGPTNQNGSDSFMTQTVASSVGNYVRKIYQTKLDRVTLIFDSI